MAGRLGDGELLEDQNVFDRTRAAWGSSGVAYLVGGSVGGGAAVDLGA